MGNTRYLTKSRYKLALECPTKLYYAANSTIYENTKIEDPFLAALADSGFQVGELAKLYFSGGVEVTSLDHDTSVQETNELLKQTDVIIYEAAFRSGNFFVRADVVVKKGNVIRLYEVKAKSFDPHEENPFFDKRLVKKSIYKLVDKWKPYLYDVAFQTYVCQRAQPTLKVIPHLTLVDKSKVATVDGLNQKFLLERDGRRARIRVVGDSSNEALGDQILCNVPVSDVVQLILDGKDQGEKTREQLQCPTFGLEAEAWAKLYVGGVKHPPKLGSECKNCEFQNKRHPDLRDGRKECLATVLKPADIVKPTVLEIWNSRKTDDYIQQGKLLLENLSVNDIDPKEGDKLGLSASERQWLQVDYTVRSPDQLYFDAEGFRSEMKQWKFPLHFIDFETATVALPFHKGRRPYEQIAFQFSHHIAFESGRVIHANQYIHDTRGEFPNFPFVRALRKALERDGGSIFRFAHHENTVLNQIHIQLSQSNEPDRDELMSWIKTITQNKDEKRTGIRNMIDMCDLVKRYFYHPMMKGSNSIKFVLPAILSASTFLQQKYARPIYGTIGEIPSINFKNKTWIEKDANGKVKDPYKSLDPIFKDFDINEVELLTSDDELNNGGAASVAFARMQFTEMNEVERNALKSALLRYCELDTLAMVMLYEAWVEWLKDGVKEKGA